MESKDIPNKEKEQEQSKLINSDNILQNLKLNKCLLFNKNKWKKNA